MAGPTSSGGRRDHYAVLGVEPTASAGQITSAYRRLVRALHPDAHPDRPAQDSRFADVVVAYGILHDPVRRAAYDSRLGLGGPGRPERHHVPAGVTVPLTVRVTPRPDPFRRDVPLWAGPTRVRPVYDGPRPPRLNLAADRYLLWQWSAG
ncbi:J domain-containing protein [Streptomyces flavidovirens]|uniref:J domain-containing protein n=1 Tax=Streptomyces flavidovirens TaxID=67298 RepID=UPI000411CE00|nr:J domain-containing protein [Streptomyces flavidovirens]